MNIGMICRMDNSGLGTLSWEFARHLKPKKILLVSNGVFQTFPERYAEFDTRIVPPTSTITRDLMNWMTEGIDVIFSCETFYNWELVKEAKLKGVKTALYTMFEMTPVSMPYKPSLFICPSELDYQVMDDPKVYLPVPVATDRLDWRERKEAKHFIHTASHGGVNFRKGTRLLIDAMMYVKSDIKLTIYSWTNQSVVDPRVEVKVQNFKNYWQVWREGDALIYPQDYNGICLPVLEAFCSGMGVVTTDMFPFNQWLPNDLMFKPRSFYRTRAASGLLEVDAAKIAPEDIAAKIDEVAQMDLTEYSRLGRDHAKKNSWEVLLPQYLKTLEDLCGQ